MAQSTLYIHIGTPKTGTTALQTFLAKNRAVLKGQGAVFPNFGLVYKGVAKNRNAHFLVATKKPFKSKEMKVCLGQIKKLAGRYSKIIISDESVWTFYGHPETETGPFWEALYKRLNAMDIDLRVIVYLRRQDQYAFSYYAQKIKEAEETRVFADYMVVDGPARARLDYAGELDIIAGIIGEEKLIVRRYDRNGFGGKDKTIQSDFLEALGINYTDDFRQGKPDRNITFHGQVLEAKRYYNMLEHPELSRHEIVAAFHGAENKLREGGRLIDGIAFCKKDRRALMDRFAAGNDHVAAKYLKAERLFDLSDLEGEDEQTVYSMEEISGVFSSMLDHLMLEEKELNYELWKKQPVKRAMARLELIRDRFRRDHKGKH